MCVKGFFFQFGGASNYTADRINSFPVYMWNKLVSDMSLVCNIIATELCTDD
jgi:hypothetical protein